MSRARLEMPGPMTVEKVIQLSHGSSETMTWSVLLERALLMLAAARAENASLRARLDAGEAKQ